MNICLFFYFFFVAFGLFHILHSTVCVPNFHWEGTLTHCIRNTRKLYPEHQLIVSETLTIVFGTLFLYFLSTL